MIERRPRLLDLFCCAGGAAMGYSRTGFEVVGVDNRPQPRYPFEFHQCDAIAYCGVYGHKFDAIHASPPCQAYTVARHIHGGEHPDLVEATRHALTIAQTVNEDLIWVIENVRGAPLHSAIMLCGTMFDLGVYRHRLFEFSSNMPKPMPPFHPQHTKGTGAHRGYSTGREGMVCVAGNNFVRTAGAKAMGIDWMTRPELAQAIPPAYTEWVGERLLAHIATQERKGST